MTAIFNSSLREDIHPDTRKSASVIPVPKVNPPNTIEKDIRPISLTPIASKTLESIILNMVNETIEENINRNQFGEMVVASTTDALVEMIHRWSEATDRLDHYVKVAPFRPLTIPTTSEKSVQQRRVAEKDRRERMAKTGDTASRTACTLGNPPTNSYNVTCVNRGYTQSAWEKTGKILSVSGHARHVGNCQC